MTNSNEADGSSMDVEQETDQVSRQSQEMFVLFIGDVGVGKSTLIKACCHPTEQRIPKTGKAASGITKEFSTYRLMDVGQMKVYGIDAIGIGDHSQKMSDFIANVEELSKQFPIHAICLLNNVITGRVGLAAQVVSTIIQLGIIKHDRQAADRIIIVGTMADNTFDEDGNRYDPEEISAWENQVVPGFDQFLGFKPHHVVWTGVPKKGPPELSRLHAKLQEIGNAVSVQMKEVENQKFVNFLKDNTGFELASEKQMQELNQELEAARVEAKKQVESMRTQLREKLAAAEQKRKAELDQAERLRVQQMDAAEARRLQELAAAENQRQAAVLSHERQLVTAQEAHERALHGALAAAEDAIATDRKRKADFDGVWICEPSYFYLLEVSGTTATYLHGKGALSNIVIDGNHVTAEWARTDLRDGSARGTCQFTIDGDSWRGTWIAVNGRDKGFWVGQRQVKGQPVGNYKSGKVSLKFPRGSSAWFWPGAAGFAPY